MRTPINPISRQHGLAVPVLLRVAGPSRWMDAPLHTRLLVGELFQWTLGAVLVAMVLKTERQPFASLGWRKPGWPTLAWGVLAALAMLLCYPLVQLGLRALGLEVSKPEGVNFRELPVWAVLMLALRAGVVEELLFRGFLLERLEWLSGKAWVGALLSLAFFVAVHLRGWSPGHLVFVTVAGGLMTLLYVWRRDLGCNILAHVLTDVVGLMAIRMQTA